MDSTGEGTPDSGHPLTCPHFLQSYVGLCLAGGAARLPSDEETRRSCLTPAHELCPHAFPHDEDRRTSGSRSILTQVLRLFRADLLGDERVRRG